ncbi:adenylosuccinate synthetase [Candidatus Moduliflexus flocculans]|uniref:Adenylosuccinate synthetase n=1 Tax=Candidatus Moduliflexus flocculans TaxID=1499966 RepID=A0A0S6VU24_9BACT|nr:adenylosuccinate synthetase [Candidatus Moduliflexus flocculans]
MKAGKHVLYEGAQGTMLDIDHGTYPYVTSSSACAGGACTGLGVGPTNIDGVLGVIKAYTTRVGEGPFPTELHDATGQRIRDLGSEYGATTGRPRRCGWFDAVVGRYAVRVNGASALAIMKMDILDAFAKIAICTGYRYRGSVVTELPMEPQALEACEPAYEEFDGWQQSTVGITQYDDLPEKAKAYLSHLSDLLETEIALISTGPKREQTIITPRCGSLLKFGAC